MASATPRRQSQPGRKSIPKSTINHNFVMVTSQQKDILKNILDDIIDNEIKKYDNNIHEHLHTKYDYFLNRKSTPLEDLLFSQYTTDEAVSIESYELPEILILLGIGIECPDAPGNRTKEHYQFLLQYYKAIINVYKNKNEGNINKDTLFNFILQYFASVCPSSS